MSTIRRKAINVSMILVIIFCFFHTFIVVTFFTNDKIIGNTNFKLHSVNTQSEFLTEFNDSNYSGIVKIFDDIEKLDSSNIEENTLENSVSKYEVTDTISESTSSITTDSTSIANLESTSSLTTTSNSSSSSNYKTNSSYTSNSATNISSSTTTSKSEISKPVNVETNVTQNTQESQEISNTSNTQTVQSSYYGYSSIGKIQIPKTGVNLPILENISVAGMEIASCFLYSTGVLNQSGNTLIVAHNYRNGKLFSNNYKLQIGDVIYITTLDGKTVTYTIYEKFITTPEDIAYIKKNDSSIPGIALSTCTDDEEARLVILAKSL